jgi:hypothetical protein
VFPIGRGLNAKRLFADDSEHSACEGLVVAWNWGEYAASSAGAVFVQGAGKQNSRSFDFVRYANFAQKDSLYFLSRTLALFPAPLRVCF